MTIGIDLQPAIDQGIVRLQYDAPQEIEVDHHFHGIKPTGRTFSRNAWCSTASRR